MPKTIHGDDLPDKGTRLELRVARLLFAEGMTPFVNVYFPRALEPRSVSSPDVDVMGCRALADASLIYTHYDCKSGDSEVTSRILLLLGMRDRIPPGPIVYVRKQARTDTKLYALQHGIRLASVGQIGQREAEFVEPLFGDQFPSISDVRLYTLWQKTKTNARDLTIGRVLRYLDGEFWTEEPFTRLRRTIAAVRGLQTACAEAGIADDDQDQLVGCVLRRFVYSFLTATARVGFFTEAETEQAAAEWLVTEKLPLKDYHNLVESVAQFVFHTYGDPAKGPLRQHDYGVPPPEYTAELIALLRRTVQLYDALPWVLPVFDAVAIEDSLLLRPLVAGALLRGARADEIERVCRWFRAVRLFLGDRSPWLRDWPGWIRILEIHSSPAADRPSEARELAGQKGRSRTADARARDATRTDRSDITEASRQPKLIEDQATE